MLKRRTVEKCDGSVLHCEVPLLSTAKLIELHLRAEGVVERWILDSLHRDATKGELMYQSHP